MCIFAQKLINETQSTGIWSTIWSAEQHCPVTLWPCYPPLLFWYGTTRWHFKLLTSWPPPPPLQASDTNLNTRGNTPDLQLPSLTNQTALSKSFKIKQVQMSEERNHSPGSCRAERCDTPPRSSAWGCDTPWSAWLCLSWAARVCVFMSRGEGVWRG